MTKHLKPFGNFILILLLIISLLNFGTFLGVTQEPRESVPTSDFLSHNPASVSPLTQVHLPLNTSELDWQTPPRNQAVDIDQAFGYQLAVISMFGIDIWWLNDTLHFTIDSSGFISNATALSLGQYGLQVWVNDTINNVLSANFTVTVAELQSWTVLVYLDGDNDLEEYAFIDFNSMEVVIPVSEVSTIVYVDFWLGDDAPFTGARCYEITHDTNPNVINSAELTSPLPSEPNMGDWQTLRDFIVFGQSYAPAHNYLLVLWDHGLGFLSVCLDDTSSDYLTTRELDLALNDPSVQKLDIVAFDACLMGQLEVAYELRECTDIIVFSEEGIPLNGFPYDEILGTLVANFTMSSTDLAALMVSLYISAYSFTGQYYDANADYVCLSAIDTSQLDTLATTLDALAQELLFYGDSQPVYEIVSQARYPTLTFSYPEYMDLMEFAINLEVQSNNRGYPVLEALAFNVTQALNQTILFYNHLDGSQGAHGLALCFGTYGSHQLDLADDTYWDEFIIGFIEVGNAFSNPLTLYPLRTQCAYLNASYDSVYFIFTTNMSGQYTFSIGPWWGDFEIDFDLYLYDASLNEVGSSTSADSTESITYSIVAGNVYLVEVYSYPAGHVGNGVFWIVTNTGGGPTIFPPINPILLAIGGGVVAVVALLLIIFYINQRRATIRPPPPRRYTRPEYTPPPSTVTRYCAYCGAMLPAQSRYCPVCGASAARD